MIWNEKVEEDDEDASDEEEEEKATNTALEYLFRRLSSALQADKFALASRSAALQAISLLLNQLDDVPALQHVLRPLYNLTDTSIPQPPGELYRALADNAQGVLDVIQKKVGAEKFVEELGKVRAQAKARREGRRQKRRIEAVAEPERWAREKRKKYEGKKNKAKAKGEEERGKRRGW
jgi:U3 small nucleolar RNA-associated protein 20